MDALKCFVKSGHGIVGSLKGFFKSEDGMGTVEIILIIVVLISLVIIFKSQLISLVNTIFSKITSQANSI